MEYYKHEDKNNDDNVYDDSHPIKDDCFELDDGRKVNNAFYVLTITMEE